MWQAVKDGETSCLEFSEMCVYLTLIEHKFKQATQLEKGMCSVEWEGCAVVPFENFGLPGPNQSFPTNAPCYFNHKLSHMHIVAVKVKVIKMNLLY